ncbi:MAG: hypothetical protein ACTSQB_04800 [Candidatus Heimdallarchaeota archaeon]
MTKYEIKSYEPGFEVDQAKIGTEIAKSYPQPHQTNAEQLKERYAQEGFNPDTRLYAFKDNKMVGFLTSRVLDVGEDGILRANVTPPQVLAEHDEVSEILHNKALDVLRNKNVKVIQATFGCIQNKDKETAKKWGYKLVNTQYYLYKIDVKSIDTSVSTEHVSSVDLKKHQEQLVSIITEEYGIEAERAKTILERWGTIEGIFAQGFVVEDGNDVKAFSFLVGNQVDPTKSRLFVIHAKGEEYMSQLLAKLAIVCKEQKIEEMQSAYTEESDIELEKYKPINFELLGTAGQFEMEL